MRKGEVMVIVVAIVVCAFLGTMFTNDREDFDRVFVPVGLETSYDAETETSYNESLHYDPEDGVFDVGGKSGAHTTGAAVVRGDVVYSLTEEEYVRVMRGEDIDAVLAERE